MNDRQDKFIIGAIVRNHFGVLTRVSSLFSRRGFNIESLVVGVTDNPEFSRMTIVCSGDESVREQLTKQLGKLYEVYNVDLMPNNAVVREHILIKIKASLSSNAEILEMFNQYGARVLDIGKSTVTADVTGDIASNEAFIADSEKYGIVEICRAGAQALARGEIKLSPANSTDN